MNKPTSYECYSRSPYFSTRHNTYFRVYDSLFEKFRGREIVFVEIGVLDGGSLFMWREFFGSSARIIGIDANPAAAKWRDAGFEIFIGDQANPKFWVDFVKEVGQVDILLDDGGHTYLQQVVTCESMIKNIRDEGIIVVEDTHTSYLRGFGPQKYSFMKYFEILVSGINKRSGRIASNEAERNIHSIEVFESIVALKINANASRESSYTTSNNGERTFPLDARHDGNNLVRALDALKKKLAVLKIIPGYRRIYINLREIAANIDTSNRPLKKYFHKYKNTQTRK